jgi:hypothetical protein
MAFPIFFVQKLSAAADAGAQSTFPAISMACSQQFLLAASFFDLKMRASHGHASR